MAEFKFSCPQCSQHIQCDTSYAGMQINCPICQKSIVVPQPPRAVAAIPKSQIWRKFLVITASVIVFAGIIVGGWFGYSKIKIYIKRGHLPSGVVALWSGEGDGNDSVGGNNGILTKISFADGKTGKSFVFKGNAKIRVPASASLDVGLGDGFTIEAWINPANFSFQSICEWNKNSGTGTGVFDSGQIGTHLELNEINADGSLICNIIDTSGAAHAIYSASGVIATNRFQHVAMTYDKTTGVGVLYCNGVVVGTANLGVFTPQTSSDFFMGTRPAGSFAGIYFHGKMDEIGLFNRALSASEIQAIYREQK